MSTPAHAKAGRRPAGSQSGMTLVELMIALTVFAIISVFILSTGAMFSDALAEQRDRTLVAMNANVLRQRLLSDAANAESAICSDADTLSFTVDPDSTLVEYYIDEGALVRWTLPPDKESLIADKALMLDCSDLGTEGLLVDLDVGTEDHPLHIYLRISDTGS